MEIADSDDEPLVSAKAPKVKRVATILSSDEGASINGNIHDLFLWNPRNI